MTRSFIVRDSADEHRQRAKQLLNQHPELRSLMGHDPWTGHVMITLVAVQLALGYLIARLDLGVLPILALAAGVGSVLNHWLAMGVHEASHNLIFRTPLANRLVALLANLPIVLPGAMSFIRHHMKHHLHLGDPKLDNDLPSRFEAEFVGNSAPRKLVWVLLYPIFGVFFRGFVKKPDRWEKLNLLMMIVWLGGVAHFLGFSPILYGLVSTYIGFGFHPVAGHWIHEHYLWDGKQETTSYYGILNKVTFNVGYHVEHHDLMNIPGRRLPELKRIASGFYENRSAHVSWGGIFFKFVTDPAISHFSRVIRVDGKNR